jgi:uncharacterized caspase-like protein
LAAAKDAVPLPSGTVITLVRYNVQLDSKGKPLTDVDAGHRRSILQRAARKRRSPN